MLINSLCVKGKSNLNNQERLFNCSAEKATHKNSQVLKQIGNELVRTDQIKKGNLTIDSILLEFVNQEVIPGTDVNAEDFWKKFDFAVHELAPVNKALIKKRENIQKQIDKWHLANKGKKLNKDEYIRFLKSINYIIEEKEDFQISTQNVDEEIAKIAGPQLVVPIDNARYALNAANARWGSLYDALYGTDVIPDTDGATKNSSYNPERGTKVIEYAKNFLDKTFPLNNGNWKIFYQFL